MYTKPFENASLEALADILIEKIKSRTDFFSKFTVVVPSYKTGQWFKTYWLKTQDQVLMNVDFEIINSTLLKLIDAPFSYSLISKEELKILIIKHLSGKALPIPSEVENYIFNPDKSFNAIKLYDISAKLAELFVEYDIEGTELSGFEKDLFDLVIKDAKAKNKGTLRSIFEESGKTKSIGKDLYFFGFTSLSQIQNTILESYEKVGSFEIYKLQETTSFNFDNAKVFATPSRLKELEVVHGQICQLLKDKKNKYSDFLVLAPSISEYESSIARVFEQDNETFPSIPYSVNDRKRAQSDVAIGLKKLVEIIDKGFCTRLDFAELISNPSIQRTRGITAEDVVTWNDAVIKMSVFREKTSGDDWDYAKKRLLLSKVSNINDVNENTVKLSGIEYIPYSSIGLDDESLNKLIGLIKDLKSWEKLLLGVSDITSDILSKTEAELDKWFSDKNADNEETNRKYKKLLRVIDSWNDYGLLENIIPLKTFFYAMLDAGTFIRSNYGELFTKGISFADFDENAILSAKYVFFMDAGSTVFPKSIVQSEIDVRTNLAENVFSRTKSAFYCQCASAGNLFISYISKNLKTDEDYYLSSLISYDEKKVERISIDEDREWDKLFTKKEFMNKDYYDGLTTRAGSAAVMSPPTPGFEWAKKVDAKDMASFLDEPLKYHAVKLFSRSENTDEKTRNEYEEFEIGNLEFEALLKDFLTRELTHNALPSQSSLESSHKIPTISKDISANEYEKLESTLTEVMDLINASMPKGPIYCKLPELSMTLNYNGTVIPWHLMNSEAVVKSEDTESNTITYMQLKKLEDPTPKTPKKKNRYFTFIYVTALMDIAGKDDDILYTVNLIRGNDHSKSFPCDSAAAKALLNNIYSAMHNPEYAKFMPIRYIGYDITGLNYNSVINGVKGEHGDWSFYEDQKLFDTESQMGYTRDNFAKTFVEFNAKMSELIIF